MRADGARTRAPAARRLPGLTRELHGYLAAHSMQPDDVLTRLSAETAQRFPFAAGMQIGPEQGAFLTLLTRFIGVRRAIEVGTFTGYSSICIARGLATGGKLTCCDVSEEWTSMARKYWQLAGVAGRLELRLGPAGETLRSLTADEDFDLAFIDADKTEYIGYWEALVPRIRPGGAILADNTLAHGWVVDPAIQDENTRGIRAFNEHAAADDRVELVLLPVGDGLTLGRKR